MGESRATAAVLPAAATGVEFMAKFFRAVGDPTRLRLVAYLLEGERSVGECVSHVGLSQGRVSVHLGCLADCGFAQVRRQGRYTFYAVADPRVAELMLLARALAADNAAALASCVRIDGPATPTPSR